MYFDEPLLAGNPYWDTKTGSIESKLGTGRGLQFSKLTPITYFAGKATPPKNLQRAPKINDYMLKT